MQKALEAYCWNDVCILTQACLSYRKMFIEFFNTDPFIFITQTQLAWRIFRSKLTKNTLYPYHELSNLKASKISVKWLESFHQNNYHKYNGGDIRIEGKYVDGYDPTTKTVYQFN